jgi:hypothetical protein
MTVNPLLGLSHRFDTETNSFVNTKHQQLAEVLQDYNPELALMWVPPKDREAADDTDRKPYAILHTRLDGNQYIVMYLSEIEMENTQNVLARIFAADMSKHDNQLAIIEAAEAARNLLAAKADMDLREEQADMARSMLKSPLHTYKLNGKKLSL